MKIALIITILVLIVINSQAQIKKEIFDFKFEGVLLNGVLNMPENDNPKGIVLIIHGSGKTNAVAQEWHYDVRETLVKSGYGTYMWDKMGSGKSGGTFDYNQSVQNSALEVIAAINTLKRKKVKGSDKIGLWGVSRAGWINPLVINQYKDIKFWISVSGVDDKENFNYLFEENLRINQYPETTIRLLLNELKEGVRLTHSGASFEKYMEATKNLRKNKFLRRFNNETEVTKKGYYDYQKTFMKQKLDKATGLIVYVENFEMILSKINIPVLALFGERDKNVDWKKTRSLYKKTLGKNTDLTIRSFPGCNHNMYKAKTGGFYEFQDDKLPWDRCDGFLNSMTDWLKKIESPSNKVVLSSEIVWEKLNPARGDKSPQAGTIWGDRKGNVATGFLAKFVDGFSSPPHIHNVTYRAVVIKGKIHNDDPKAENMWMKPGSFWTQPQGEAHVTSASGEENIAYVEIDKGPYLVKPTEEAFDNGERPVNIDASNVVWLNSDKTTWIDQNSKAEISFLWESKEKKGLRGLFVKLPKGFNGNLESTGNIFHSVIIKGELNYKMPQTEEIKKLDAGSYFSSKGNAIHKLSNGSESENIFYIRTNGNIKINELK